MSRVVTEEWGASGQFELDDLVWFDGPYGDRMYGKIARVYNARQWYHVEVEGTRYMVNIRDDHMSRNMEPGNGWPTHGPG